jgi:hypothetical protein
MAYGEGALTFPIGTPGLLNGMDDDPLESGPAQEFLDEIPSGVEFQLSA